MRANGSRAMRIIKITALVLAAAVVLAALCTAGINLLVKGTTKSRIVTPEEAAGFDADCVLVLGAGALPNGRPSQLLADRLDTGIGLYRAGASDRLLLSGDHGHAEYDEVNAMKNYTVEALVPADDIYLDHAGFSTYESMYRARFIFGVERVVVVTQSYHLYRALYIARALGMEAVGVASDAREYANQSYYDAREALARVKDFIYSVIKPEPTYLGEAIPITGPASATDG